MKEQQNSLNKKLNILCYLIPFISLLFVDFEIDNDTYWIMKTGEYIVNHGIPLKDPLTFHSTMGLIVQQWIPDIIFYKTYSWLGAIGPMLVVLVMFALAIMLLNKFASMLTDKPLNRCIIIFIASAYLRAFEVTRPQIFTYCLVLIELICLESFVRDKKIKHLFVLPFIAVVCINFHASMFTMLFLVMLPYIVQALASMLDRKDKIDKISALPLLVAFVIMFACGFINPYGIKGVAFLFTASVGDKVNGAIDELNPLVLNTNISDMLYFMVPVIVLFCYLANRKGRIQLRFLFLTLGTGVMMLAYVKLLPYFVICAFPTLLYYADNVDVTKLLPSNQGSAKRQYNKGVKMLIIVIIGVLYLGVFGVAMMEPVDFVKTNGATAGTLQMDEAISYMQADADAVGIKDVKLYNGFDAGGYLEYKGYKTYIDARADSFLEENNGEYDYLTEYYDLNNGKLYYKSICDKYDFDYYFICKGENTLLYVNLKNDSDFTTVFENDTYAVIKKA